MELHRKTVDEQMRVLLLADVKANIDQNSVLSLTHVLQCWIDRIELGKGERKGVNRSGEDKDEGKEDTDATSSKGQGRLISGDHLQR